MGQIVAGPFILLIALELLLLIRLVVVSSAASEESESDEEPDEKQAFVPERSRSCCSRWNGRRLIKMINVILLINPFFGCFIAWRLLYQSDRTECLLVLGLEFGSIALHFFGVGLSERIRTWRHFLFHCIQLIPFIASVASVLIYLKQQGVCYIVEQALFHFQGCETCPDGYPPIAGNCTDKDGNSFVFGNSNLLDLGNWDTIDEWTRKTSNQQKFCGGQIEADHIRYDDGRWENTNFCFFPFE